MTDSRQQKNLKLTDSSIGLLRFLSYIDNATEAEVVEQSLVTAIALKVVRILKKANKAPIQGEECESLIEAKYMAQKLQQYDPEKNWKVAKDSRGLWGLQYITADGREVTDIPDEEWRSWP